MLIVLWLGGYFLTGVTFGTLFFVILRKIVKPGVTGKYFKSLIENFFGLLKEEDKFWSSYKNIIRDSFCYAGLQMGGFILALLPVGVFVFFAGEPLLSLWNDNAKLTVIPIESGRLIQRSSDASRAYFQFKDGHLTELDQQLSRHVFCPPDSIRCQSLALLGFTRATTDPVHLQGQNKIILRYDHDDWNPFWPYLDDLEFMFSLGFSFIMLLLSVTAIKKQKHEDGRGYQIGAIDYMLTCLAKYHSGIWNKLGNWETVCFKFRLKKIAVNESIYITGLARSGSTILLELLASVKGLASHRYRDAPFLMTPIFWNKFISVFSSKQELRERPHQDRIHINRESPEAFEELIWQYYFPKLHDEAHLHILNEENKNPGFDQFYNDHIKKILHIRKGSRYLSKGNYNIARIGYIHQLYPDAYFVVPIRHPLTQVYSLVCQHDKFLEYARQNPQVSEYLEAAGHYEFGPQRKPVCMTLDGAKRAVEAWKSGDDDLGYAIQWADIYRHVHQAYLNNPELAKKIFILRYEDLCANPAATMSELLKFLNLKDEGDIERAAQTISAPSYTHKLSDDRAGMCWDEVKSVAELYDYKMTL